MFKFNSFNVDDRVVYVGSRYSKELGGKQGFVISPVMNEEYKYVVEFGDDAYVVNESSLAPFRATAKESGPEIRQIKKRFSEEDK